MLNAMYQKGFIGAVLAASLANFIAITPASAGPPRLPEVTSWSGFYIGGNVGYGRGRASSGLSVPTNLLPFFTPGNIPAVVAGASNSFDLSHGFAGVQIGYLTKFNKIVAGIEAGYDWSSLTSSVSTTNVYPLNAPNTFTFNETVEMKGLFTLLGRVGFDMGDWYPYITGGVAVTRLKYTNTFIDPNYCTANCPLTSTLTQTKAGGAFGFGLEWRIDNHWSLRGEYLRMQFGGVGGTVAGPATLTGFVSTFSHSASSFSEDTARAAVSYRF